MEITIKHHARGCKTLSQVVETIVKGRMHGVVFMQYTKTELEERTVAERELALEMVRNQLHLLPKKIKIDIQV